MKNKLTIITNMILIASAINYFSNDNELSFWTLMLCLIIDFALLEVSIFKSADELYYERLGKKLAEILKNKE